MATPLFATDKEPFPTLSRALRNSPSIETLAANSQHRFRYSPDKPLAKRLDFDVDNPRVSQESATIAKSPIHLRDDECTIDQPTHIATPANDTPVDDAPADDSTPSDDGATSALTDNSSANVASQGSRPRAPTPSRQLASHASLRPLPSVAGPMVRYLEALRARRPLHARLEALGESPPRGVRATYLRTSPPTPDVYGDGSSGAYGAGGAYAYGAGGAYGAAPAVQLSMGGSFARGFVVLPLSPELEARYAMAARVR